MIRNADAVRILNEHRGDGVMVPTMNANNVNIGLPSIPHDDELDIPLSGCMGKASSFGLGLALAQPERKVIVLDGDGSLLMNLGSLVTISTKSPENLYHFVFENGIYAITGGQTVPGEGKSSFQGLAREAGYATVFEFDDTEELASNIDSVLPRKGPVLVCLKIVPEIENTLVHFRQRSRRNMQIAIADMAKVFGR